MSRTIGPMARTMPSLNWQQRAACAAYPTDDEPEGCWGGKDPYERAALLRSRNKSGGLSAESP